MHLLAGDGQELSSDPQFTKERPDPRQIELPQYNLSWLPDFNRPILCYLTGAEYVGRTVYDGHLCLSTREN